MAALKNAMVAFMQVQRSAHKGSVGLPYWEYRGMLGMEGSGGEGEGEVS